MWRLLEKRLNKLGIKHIDLLVLTHSHFDHAANAAKIRKRYKSQIIIHQSETGFLMNGDSIPPVGSNRVINFLINAFALLPGTTAIYEPCYFDYTFIDRFDLSKFGFNAYLMHTPGHTKGSISIIIDNEFAIVGDTMFAIFPRTAFPLIAFDKMQLLNSWEQLLNTGCEIFIPSHGSVVKRALFENEFKKEQFP